MGVKYTNVVKQFIKYTIFYLLLLFSIVFICLPICLGITLTLVYDNFYFLLAMLGLLLTIPNGVYLFLKGIELGDKWNI